MVKLDKKGIRILKKLILVGIFIFLTIESVWVARNKLFPSVKKVSLNEYASRMVNKCANASIKQTCYDKEVVLLMHAPYNLTMEESFKVTRLIQDQDSEFPYCHVLGHELSATETKKNPSLWKDVITRCPSGTCSNGCIHGAFQERFRTDVMTDEEIEKIKPDLYNVCEPRGKWKPTGMEQASCYHAMGHLIMYITNADLVKSTRICEEIVKKSPSGDFLRVCLDGNYMQIFQPLEPEDFALVKGKQPKKEEVVSFCGKFSGDRKSSCLSESWPLFFEELKKPQGMVDLCSKQEPKEQERCYNGLVYVMTSNSQFDLDFMKNYCLGLPEKWRGRCFANTASRMIETDYRFIEKSVNWCKDMAIYDKNNDCFKELIIYSTFNFKPDSEGYSALCNSLPGEWKVKCLSKEKKTK